MKDFTIGLVLALAEREVLVVDKPAVVVHAALESAYEAIRDDVERERDDSKHRASNCATITNAYEPAEIVDFALRTGLMIRDPQAHHLRIMNNEQFIRAYYSIKPTCGTLYKKAAQAFVNSTGQ